VDEANEITRRLVHLKEIMEVSKEEKVS